MNSPDLPDLLVDIRACRICRDSPHTSGKRSAMQLPHAPRPVLQLSPTSQVLIAGQAPGARVHQSGKPFTDPSGDRLRAWLGLSHGVFYDAAKIAIVPMGFCFPGYNVKGADLPPRTECRSTWHDRLFAARAPFALTLSIGRYARDYHMPAHRKETLTQTLSGFAEDLERANISPALPLPHPSWRNTAWLKRNPWFERDLLPVIAARVAHALAQHE